MYIFAFLDYVSIKKPITFIIKYSDIDTGL